MLLPTRCKLPLDHQVGGGNGCCSVTLADRAVVDQVASTLGVYQWGGRIESQHMVSQCWKIFVAHLYQACPLLSSLLALSDNQGHPVTDESYVRGTEERLISGHQPIRVVRDISCGEDPDDARMGQSSRSINGFDQGVGTIGANQFEMKHTRSHEITRIASCAGYFGEGIRTGQ